MKLINVILKALTRLVAYLSNSVFWDLIVICAFFRYFQLAMGLLLTIEIQTFRKTNCEIDRVLFDH